MRDIYVDAKPLVKRGGPIVIRLVFVLVAVLAIILISGFSNESNGPVIVIDPGHGGQDSGAVGITGVYEKDLNLQMALILKEHFENAGYQVVMTRTEDTDTDGQEGFDKTTDIINRQKICEENGENAIFLMVHMNASTSSRDKGFQVFYGTKDRERSQRLAQSIYKSVKETALVTRLREVKEAPQTVYLCQNIDVECVLIECGFITNEADTNLLTSVEYRKDLAYALFCGVNDYIVSNMSSLVK